MLESIACLKSRTSARDLLKSLLPNKAPSLDEAIRIADDLKDRGMYVNLNYLLDVWNGAGRKEDSK